VVGVTAPTVSPVVFGQRFNVVELGEAAVGEMQARSRAVLIGTFLAAVRRDSTELRIWATTSVRRCR
jgi:hypothetical protein